MSRNELCPCGSGKRYKHCHGSSAVQAAAPGALHLEALAAHQAWSLTRAEVLYRRAIEADPRDVESVHMLGMVHFERRRYREALELLWDAAERTGWTDTTLRQNLGLVLAKLLTAQANARQEAVVAAYAARKRAIAVEAPRAERVSVVLTTYNEAPTVGRAIASVAAQTYADIELVVVDDGSTDRTAAVVEQALAPLSFPAHLIRLVHGGAAQAANVGAERATGRYLAFLHGSDTFAPNRIERMVAALVRATPLWGFSRVAAGADEAASDARGKALHARHFLAHEPVSFTLLARDVAESSGNVFVERDLFDRIGGFRDLAAHRGWDFCVRAAREVEPIAVPEPLYIRGRPASGATDIRRAQELLVEALGSDADVTNELSPQFPANRDVLLRAELRAGRGDRLPIPMLKALAADWRGRADTPSPRRAGATTNAVGDKAAIVVLGMYRSGTSAFARALNLCGAFLPERVLAARLGINPKGFWEAEAITDLDVRFMELLGGDWHRVGFELPSGGPLVEQFLQSSREALANDYEDAPLIVIKDPRMCVLGPLWHRALKQAGYRPTYVVVARHPLEVAGSIETQGDMPLADGLALWLTYMRRLEQFVESGVTDVVHVRYAELLDDWRGVVRRIARRLAVPLDVDARAAEVDRFLESDMRYHKTEDADRDARLTDDAAALYRRLLARCDRDAADAVAIAR
jgi:hypothetical protein